MKLNKISTFWTIIEMIGAAITLAIGAHDLKESRNEKKQLALEDKSNKEEGA